MNSNYYKTIEVNFLRKHFKSANPTTSIFDPADFILELNGVTVIGEIKFRHQHINSFKHSKFLEVKKLNALKEKAKSYNNVKIVYINLFEDSQSFCLWRLDEIDFDNRTVHYDKMNSTTANDFNYSKIQEKKAVYHISVEESKIIGEFSLEILINLVV